MDAEKVFQYWKALKAIRAHEQRAMIEATMYPQLKNKQDREATLRDLKNAVKMNVSDGDIDREMQLERILAERRNGERKS